MQKNAVEFLPGSVSENVYSRVKFFHGFLLFQKVTKCLFLLHEIKRENSILKATKKETWISVWNSG